MATAIRTGKRGPEPKGDRVLRSLKMPRDLVESLLQEAAALEISFSDYVVLLCAQGQGVPEPDYIWTTRDRERAKRAEEKARREGHQDPLWLDSAS